MVGLGVGAGAAQGLAQNKWTPIVLGVVIIGVGAISYFGIVKPLILCPLGVVSCSGDKRRQRLENRLKESDALNPNFYSASKLTMSHDSAKVKADELASALSGADDEEAVYSILQSAKNKQNMSLISKYYQMRHEQSLSDSLGYDMSSEEELDRMLGIVENY